MNYLLINKIEVQNANAIAGFTWGFPAITHFLGFSHNLNRKLGKHKPLADIKLSGCGVTCHHHHTYTYEGMNSKTNKPEGLRFTQQRTPPYRSDVVQDKTKTPSIIEEGKMNMTVSLLIGLDGNPGNRTDNFLTFIKNCCYTQKLAGGTVLNIEGVEILSAEKDIKRKLMPGFALMDRAHYLEKHFKQLKQESPDSQLLEAWLDFSALKRAARPAYYLIDKHIKKQGEEIVEIWEKHLEQKPFKQEHIPDEINAYFERLEESKQTKKLLEQWQSYCSPNEKTNAIWEYLAKPESGYLVPMMTGYKAISSDYKNNEVAGTRDNETPVCFVESVHSIGEWLSPHRIPQDDLASILWHYRYEENWYLCKQNNPIETDADDSSSDY